MPRCSSCKEILETVTYGSAIAYECPQCGTFYDDTVSRRSLVELVHATEPEGQEVISDVSTRCCHSIVQYLRLRIDPSLIENAVIPLIWGTTARSLYSPLSDIDIVFIIPDRSREKVREKAKEFRIKIRNEEIRLKRLLQTYSKSTYKKIPPSISEKRIPFSTEFILESKFKSKITCGMEGKAKPFQPPQMILLSCALPLKNVDRFVHLREELLDNYRELADAHDVLLEQLAAGLYLYDGLAHIYYGRKSHSEIHSLPSIPKCLPKNLLEATFRGDLWARGEFVPEFKSLDFREWEFEQGVSLFDTIDNGTKILYRCLCDFLVSANVLCSRTYEDLSKYKSSFDIVREKFFDQQEKHLFFLAQKWRLGVLPGNRNRLWQVAALAAKVISKRIAKHNLEDEIESAKKLFFETLPIDYSAYPEFREETDCL